MPQIFHYSANYWARASILGVGCLVAFVAWAGYEVNRGSYETRKMEAREQPVPFSHAHHVGALGIDCRYCHTSVEESSFAGIPPTKTCINCHSRVDQMPLMWKANTLEMSWCLDCHRNTQRALRPLDQITTMGYVPDGDQEEIGRRLQAEYHTPDVRVLTSCSTCHR